MGTNKINITRRELDKLELSKEMLDRVMNYLEKNHFDIWNFITQKEIEIIRKDIAELQGEVWKR